MIVSIYKGVRDKKSQSYFHVGKVLQTIKGKKYANIIHRVRQATDKDEKARLKQDLTSICFSGKFEERLDSKILEHSGLVVLDFDHVPGLENFKKEICKDEYTFSAFISPSGDGLKVLFKIPPEIGNHESYYLGIVKYCKTKKYPILDTTSKNISRVCFVSYDPELYYNLKCKIFTTKGTLKTTEIKVERHNAQQTEYDKLQICCDMIRNTTDGNKHHTLIKASRLAGGYISGGYVEEFEAVRLLQLEINKRNPTNFKLACVTIQDGIDYGKTSPIPKKEY
jgi:hypothetical protein